MGVDSTRATAAEEDEPSCRSHRRRSGRHNRSPRFSRLDRSARTGELRLPQHRPRPCWSRRRRRSPASWPPPPRVRSPSARSRSGLNLRGPRSLPSVLSRRVAVRVAVMARCRRLQRLLRLRHSPRRLPPRRRCLGPRQARLVLRMALPPPNAVVGGLTLQARFGNPNADDDGIALVFPVKTKRPSCEGRSHCEE